jgi:hypothetical protein
MELIDATDLLLTGAERARSEGWVSAYNQNAGPDYTDIQVFSLIEGLTWTILVRCYRANRKLTATDIANVRDAAKEANARMTLICWRR